MRFFSRYQCRPCFVPRRATGSATSLALPKLINGRPPALLRSGKTDRAAFNARARDVRRRQEITEGPRSFPKKGLGQDGKTLCAEDAKFGDVKAALVIQAASLDGSSTFADCVSVLQTLADRMKGAVAEHPEEASVRYLADLLSQRHSHELVLHSDHRRNLCLAASALARTSVWVSSFGDVIKQIFGEEDGSHFDKFNVTDVVQLCRYIAVFDRFFGATDKAWAAAYSQLQHQEQRGEKVKAIGLVSLLRSVVISNGASESATKFHFWVRSRLLNELPTCSPRQLASALLDLGALQLVDATVMLHLQREINHALSRHTMRARDLTCIISGYSRLPLRLLERQNLMTPLLPEMIRLMPGCSVQDMCELLHGLASAHITSRTLLGVWSANFVRKASFCTQLRTSFGVGNSNNETLRWPKEKKRRPLLSEFDKICEFNEVQRRWRKLLHLVLVPQLSGAYPKCWKRWNF